MRIRKNHLGVLHACASILAPVLALVLVHPLTARAAVTQPLPPSLAFEAMSETMPTAFAPAEFSAEDFALEWEGPPLPGVEVRLQGRSREWVRVQDVLVLPRARSDFRVARATKGSV